ncbi:BMP family lipoprotein [Actinoalloteichus hymeniacidonis]|uniref:Basic membrane lipoprotein n=1 Tax=Actinoalloteichus hymeniacidonis TaxID=340345 RepID=A0AAC9HU63_9PSEU|nr:BMP family ABC transporter substrate-binding protein [Actinoalloteichus hymeniacidonis]AOS65662.1 basic membrane lipoprotein [Actinoalloteichus hymeniacidonis]MBB5906248.1 basic membrane protein A [Actinoalloteichus hymeniacidonis]
MRRPRGAALAAIALTGALALAGCARDSGSGGGDGGGDSAAGNGGCELAEAPVADAEATPSTVPTEDVDGSELRVGLAYDIGGRGDASFNDAAAAGLDRAIEELGVSEDNVRELTAAANESEDAKQTRLRQLADEGFNPIIGVGFAYAESFKIVAEEFPDVEFALVDADVPEADNVTGLLFAEHEGSFLTGVAAAYESENCHIGFVGGVENPLIQKFEAGFLAGAQAAAPDITIENTYLTSGSDITGFQDPARGNEAARGQIEAGADVLYHASGASGQGVFEAAYADDIKAIGVDSDQYNQEIVGEAHEIIITSMLKRVDVAVFDFLAAVAQDDLSVMPELFNLEVDGVGYSTSGDLLAPETIEALEGYRAGIISGDIEVPDTP